VRHLRANIIVFLFIVYTAVAFKIDAQNTFRLQSTKVRTDSFQNALIATNDGGFLTKHIIAGSNGTFFTIVLSRYNSCAQLVWSKYFTARSYAVNNYFVSFCTSVIKVENENFLLVYTDDDNPFENCVITKLDSGGNILWAKKIQNNIGSGIINKISCSSINSNGYVLAWSTDSIVGVGQYTMKGFVASIDKKGNCKWAKSFRSIFYFEQVVSFPDKTLAFLFGNSQIIHTDSLGNALWTAAALLPFGPITTGTGISNINVGKNGNLYCYGVFAYPQGVSGGLILFSMDENKNLIWGKIYSGMDTAAKPFIYTIMQPLSVRFMANGNLILVNTKVNPDSSYLGAFPAVVLETDSIGNLLKGKILTNINSATGRHAYNLANSDDVYSLHNSDITGGNDILVTGMDKNRFANTVKLSFAQPASCIGYDTMLLALKASPTLSFSGSNISLIPVKINIYDITVHSINFKNKSAMFCSAPFIPMANLGSDTVLCSGQSYILRKGAQNAGAQTFWSTGDTTDSIIITKTGRYWLQVSHGYCTSADTVTVVFKSQLKTGLPKQLSFCPYDSMQLKVNNLVASYTGASLWYWITPEKDTVAGDSIMAKDSGNYYLMLNGTQCPNVDTVHIMYYPLPMASAGPDTILCYNETYTMQGAGGISYTWRPAIYLSSATDPKAEAKLPNSESYILVVKNTKGCQDSSKVLLKVRPALKVKSTVNDGSVCYGQSITLTARGAGGDSLHYHFNWAPDNLTGDSISGKLYQSGWHKIILSDNCTPANATDSVFVSVTPPAKAAFIYSPATKIKTNHNVSFINQSTNASSYLWNFGTKDSSKEVSPVYIYTDTGDYQITLVAYGLNSCANDTAYGFIKIISGLVTVYIPNAFSPNNDGINDYFNITGVGIKSYTYNIYNRWGENIFSTTSDVPPLGGQGAGEGEAAWDGNFKGAEAPEGIYIYTVDVIDIDGIHHFMSGNVTLMR